MKLIRRAILALALSAGLAPAFAQPPAPVPALPDSERRTSYSITASICVCAVNFALYGDSTDYQAWIEVFLNGVRVNSSDPTFGWTVTSPSGPLANLARPISNAVLTFNAAQTGAVQIVGARRPRRASQFPENRGVPARDLNQALTDIVAQNRETWDKLNDVTGRTVLARPGETLAPLPALANRRNLGACFDDGGNLTSCTTIPGSTTIAAGAGITFTGSGPTVISATAAGRTVLTTGTNFYLDPIGTDTPACGLATGASACRQPQYLSDLLLTKYDLGFQAIAVQFADGPYNAWQVTGPYPGSGASHVLFVGNVAAQSNVIIDGTSTPGYCVQALEYASFIVRGMQVQNCALGIAAPELHSHILFDHITWASMPSSGIGIYVSRQSYVDVIGPGNIIKSIGGYFIESSHQGNFRAGQILTGDTAFTLGADVTCGGAFAYASSLGDITFTGYGALGISPFSTAGHTAGCTQWVADSGGVFQAVNTVGGLGLMPILFPGVNPGHCIGSCSVDESAHAGTTIHPLSCGTGASISGDDYNGTVTEGTSATGCVIDFHSVFSRAPLCTYTWDSAPPTTPTKGVSTFQLSLAHGSASGAVFTYACRGG